MLEVGEIKVEEEDFFGAKRLINICDVDVNSRRISGLIQVKKGLKYLIGYFDYIVKPLIVTILKMTRYAKRIDDNELMLLCINDEKLLGKYKDTWNKIGKLKGVGLTAFQVHDDNYVKYKIKTYGKKLITDFDDQEVTDNGIKWKCSN